MYSTGDKTLFRNLLEVWSRGNIRQQHAANYGRFIQAIEDRNYAQAEIYLEPLLKAEPDNVWYLDIATDLNLVQKHTTSAIQKLQAAKGIESNSILQLNLINAFVQGSEPVKVINLLNRYIFDNKTDPNGWELLAQAEASLNHRDRELAARVELKALSGKLEEAILLLRNASEMAKTHSLEQARYDSRIDQIRRLQEIFKTYETH